MCIRRKNKKIAQSKKENSTAAAGDTNNNNNKTSTEGAVIENVHIIPKPETTVGESIEDRNLPKPTPNSRVKSSKEYSKRKSKRKCSNSEKKVATSYRKYSSRISQATQSQSKKEQNMTYSSSTLPQLEKCSSKNIIVEDERKTTNEVEVEVGIQMDQKKANSKSTKSQRHQKSLVSLRKKSAESSHHVTPSISTPEIKSKKSKPPSPQVVVENEPKLDNTQESENIPLPPPPQVQQKPPSQKKQQYQRHVPFISKSSVHLPATSTPLFTDYLTRKVQTPEPEMEELSRTPIVRTSNIKYERFPYTKASNQDTMAGVTTNFSSSIDFPDVHVNENKQPKTSKEKDRKKEKQPTPTIPDANQPNSTKIKR